VSRVTIAVLQTAVLPASLESVSSQRGGPVLWDGRLSPTLIVAGENLRRDISESAELMRFAYSSHEIEKFHIIRELFKKIDLEYDEWLYVHLVSQIEALLSFCDSRSQLQRPDVLVLPEYSVTAACALRLANWPGAAGMTMIAGTHAWRVRDWPDYPLKKFASDSLTRAIDAFKGGEDSYLSVCPVISFQGGPQIKLIPKLLRSAYEENLFVPKYEKRDVLLINTRNANGVKLAVYICSEFIRHPVVDDDVEVAAYDSIFNSQADASLIAIPAYSPETEIFRKDFATHIERMRKPRLRRQCNCSLCRGGRSPKSSFMCRGSICSDCRCSRRQQRNISSNLRSRASDLLSSGIELAVLGARGARCPWFT
jgi:hypothetical protein